MAKILIVEDEAILAMTTRLDLERVGHAVVGIADNAADAIKIAQAEQPDIILMDIVLKGDMNGIEASQRICHEDKCKVIYMTAHTDEATLKKAKSTRHFGFLYKPFQIYQLKEAIDKSLRDKQV